MGGGEREDAVGGGRGEGGAAELGAGREARCQEEEERKQEGRPAKGATCCS